LQIRVALVSKPLDLHVQIFQKKKSIVVIAFFLYSQKLQHYHEKHCTGCKVVPPGMKTIFVSIPNSFYIGHEV